MNEQITIDTVAKYNYILVDIYFKWYIWFFGINVAAIGYFIQNKIIIDSYRVILLAMPIFNFLGVMAAFFLVLQSFRVQKFCKINEFNSHYIRTLIPTDYFCYAGIATGTTMLLCLIAWLIIIFAV